MDLKDKNEDYLIESTVSGELYQEDEQSASQSKDSELVDEIYELYGKSIYAKCIMLFKNKEIVKELTPYIILKSYLALVDTTDPLENKSVFIKQLTYKTCLRVIERVKKEQGFRIYSNPIATDAYSRKELDTIIAALSTRDLKAALSKIPIGDKVPLLMTYQDDMSIQSLAKTLNWDLELAKVRLRNAQYNLIAVTETL